MVQEKDTTSDALRVASVIALGATGAAVAKKFTKCGVGPDVNPSSIVGDVRRPLSILEGEQKFAKRNLLKKADNLRAVLKNAKGAQREQALADMRAVEKQLADIPSERIERIMLDTNNEMEAVTVNVSKDLNRLSELGGIDPKENKAILTILGDEKLGVSADTLIGRDPKGRKVQSIDSIIAEKGGIEKIEKGEASTGFKALDEYIKSKGAKGLEKVKTIASAFRQMALSANLPPEKFIDNYFPNIQSRLDRNLEQIVKGADPDVIVGSKDDLKLKLKKEFLEKARKSTEFTADLPVAEALSRYMFATRKIIQRGALDELINIRFDEADEFSEAGLKALDQLLDNLTTRQAPGSSLEKLVSSFQSKFYQATLTNNISSTVNNTTSLGIVASRFGGGETAGAVKEALKGSKSKFAPILDAFGIGGEGDAVSVFTGLAIDELPLGQAKLNAANDLFTKSEQYVQRVAGIAALKKAFRGREAELFTKLASNKKQDILDIAAIAKKGVLETMFTNISGNAAWVDRSPLGRAAFTFLRHPIRETAFVGKRLLALGTGGVEGRKRAAEELSRYFISKTLLMGSQAPFLFIPQPFLDYMNEQAPEVVEEVKRVSSVLDIFNIPKMLTGGNVDLSESQGLIDISKILVYGFDADELPILRQLTNIQRKGVKYVGDLVSGKPVETSDFIDFLSILKFIAKPTPKIPFTNIPVGVTQWNKIGQAANDLATGKSEFFGVERDIEETGKLERIARAFSPGTSVTTATIRAKASRTNRDLLVGLALKGKRDVEVFRDFVFGRGGKEPAMRSLINAATAELKSKGLKGRELTDAKEAAHKKIKKLYKRV